MSKTIATQISPVETIAKLTALKSHQLDKSSEVELFAAIVKAVPANTYLADYLNGAVEHFEDMAKSDLCFPMMDRILQLYRDKVEAEANLKAVLEKVKAAESMLSEAEYSKRRVVSEMDEIKSLVRSISETIARAGK